MTADLVAFLNARLDERQAIAQAVNNPSPWRTAYLDEDGDPYEMELVYDADNNPVLFNESRYQDFELAAHIAANDPAHVLADVQAKRAILAEHEHRAKLSAEGYYDDHAELVDLDWLVRLLVQPFADHPDFRSEWRVSPYTPGVHPC